MTLSTARRDPKRAWLRSIPGLDGLSAREIGALAATADRARVRAGTTLIHEGELGNDCFIIASGWAMVVRDGQLVDKAGPGSIVGEVAALDRTSRNADVVAITDLDVAVLHVQSLQSVLSVNPRLRAFVQQAAAEHRPGGPAVAATG